MTDRARNTSAVLRMLGVSLLIAGLGLAVGCSDNPTVGLSDNNVTPSPGVEPNPEPAPQPDPLPEMNPDMNPDPLPEMNPEPNPDMNPEPNPEPNPDMNPEPNPDMNPDMNPGMNPDPNPEPIDPNRPPTLLEITPNRGSISGGTSVLVIGDNFTEQTSVFLGTRRLQQLEFISDSQLLGLTPPGIVGPVDVKVVTQNGEDILSRAYSYFEPLSVRNISPNRSPVEGGEVAILTGSGFSEQTLVTVGGRAAIEVTFVDSETLQIVTPPGEPGRKDVRVTDVNSSALLAGAMTYYTPIDIERVFPSAGSVSGGNPVRIIGAGFEEGTSVRFGDITVDSQFINDGELSVFAPPGAPGFANITVSNDNGIAGLVDGYYYIGQPSDSLEVYGIGPAAGPASGGQLVTIVGENLNVPGLTITLGGNAVEVQQVQADSVTAITPEGSVGDVDLVVSNESGSVTLEDAYSYLPTLDIAGIEPATGDVAGGNDIVVTGEGFTADTVIYFGSQRAIVSAVSDTEMTVVAPMGTVGTVDVEVRNGPLRDRIEDGYAYTQPINIFGITPTKGSVAGGTFVVIRGEGFVTTPTVTFGQEDGLDVERLDTSTITVRTPTNREGSVDVTLTFGEESIRAPDRFTFFNPGTRFGGVWGDTIQGAVNVSVFSTGGNAIENAYVTLSVTRDSPYRGFTNAGGQVTFSGPDLSGRQNVTAVAAGHSSATVQSFNAENVTVFLAPLDGEGAPPGGPPLGTITGLVSGVEKVGDPGPNEFELAIVYTTQIDPFRGNPATGPGNVVLGNGRYTLNSRVGDVAVVVLAGLFNNLTEEFTPLYMGVRRYLFVSQDQTYEIDIEADIPLNAPITFKVTGAPRGIPGPDVNQVIPYLDFGFEGVFGGIDIAEGDDEFITAENQPPLDGILADLSFFVLGGAWTGGRAPYSLAIMRNIVPDGVVELPPLLGVPSALNPTDGGRVVNNYVEFSPNTTDPPDFYFIQIEKLDRTPVWDVFLPGNEPYFQLPELPDFSDLPIDERPAPFVGGPLVMTVTSARAFEFDYDNFEYNDFGLDNWEVFSTTAWLIQLR